jgi:hypothetical protein
MGNGGIIGVANVPTADVASGVWTLDELFLARKTDTWPSLKFAFELVKPSSVVVSGGSASATVSSLGSVSFTSCETLSLNGVFQSGYDNYMVVVRHLGSAFTNVWARMRAAGTDATGTNYTRQVLFANSGTIQGARDTSQTFAICSRTGDNERSGDCIYFYGPNLAQPTAIRNVNVTGKTVSGTDGTQIADNASTHSLSTSYDGFTLAPVSGSLSGRVVVYGMRG